MHALCLTKTLDAFSPLLGSKTLMSVTERQQYLGR